MTEDVFRADLMAYQYQLHMQKRRLMKLQKELDDRQKKAEDSSMKRAQVSSSRATSVGAANRARRSMSRLSTVLEAE
jgi:hypothetical protein